MTHKSGFVNIIGNPNVGKSTLMNALVGERLSIITSKMQTTRHRILGIVNSDDFQIVYSDTPGILKPNYELQESMLKSVNIAFSDADILLYVTDFYEDKTKNEKYIERIQHAKAPVIVCINKSDSVEISKHDEHVNEWQQLTPDAEIIVISALEKHNLDKLFETLLKHLPEGEAFYPKDALTDRPERFFVAEIIREKILLNYQKEIPYSVEVAIEVFKEEEKIVRISAIIYVARNSQKGIVIGHQGKMLKRVGTQARKDMEVFLDKKVFLELFVKVQKDWRNNSSDLHSFGYQ